VLDTIGEWSAPTKLATVVFVGGSFGRRGGQNILEPAAYGKPVLFGPRMENFQDSVQVLVGRGGLQVKGPMALLRLMPRSARASRRDPQAWGTGPRVGVFGPRRPRPATRG